MTTLTVDGTVVTGGSAAAQLAITGLPNVTAAAAQANGYTTEWDQTYALPTGATGIYFGHENNSTVSGHMPSGAQVWHNLDRMFVSTSTTAGNTGDLVNRFVQTVRNSGFGCPGQTIWGQIIDAVDITGNDSNTSGGLLGLEIDLECNGDDNGSAERQGLVVALLNKTGGADPRAKYGIGVWSAGAGTTGGYYSAVNVACSYLNAAVDLRNATNHGGNSGHAIWMKTGADIALDTSAATKISSDGTTITLTGDASITGTLSVSGVASDTYSSGFRYDTFGVGQITSSTTLNIGVDAGLAGIHSGAFIASSDARLKSDIKPISPEEGEAFVRGVSPSVYTISGRKDAGFIAQEVIKSGHGHLVVGKRNELMAQVRHEDGSVSPAGVSFGLNYDGTIPYLAAALKGALDRIAELEGRSKNAGSEAVGG